MTNLIFEIALRRNLIWSDIIIKKKLSWDDFIYKFFNQRDSAPSFPNSKFKECHIIWYFKTTCLLILYNVRQYWSCRRPHWSFNLLSNKFNRLSRRLPTTLQQNLISWQVIQALSVAHDFLLKLFARTLLFKCFIFKNVVE